MRKFYSTFLCLTFFLFVTMFGVKSFAQNSFITLWSDISEASLDAEGTRYIIPQSYRTLELEFEDFVKYVIKLLKKAGRMKSCPIRGEEGAGCPGFHSDSSGLPVLPLFPVAPIIKRSL